MNAARTFIFGIALMLLAGCGMVPSNTARNIVQAQTPGNATGAGATLIGPANSATPTSQTAERSISFYVPALPVPSPVVPAIEVGTLNAQRSTFNAQVPEIRPAPLLQPALIQERVTTQIGAHQDAAGIVKVAATLSGWSSVKWIGLICILVCLGGLLWSHGNPDGYPVVFWKVGGVGLALILIGDHPAWLLLLLIPLGFYAVQKLNLLRIP